MSAGDDSASSSSASASAEEGKAPKKKANNNRNGKKGAAFQLRAETGLMRTNKTRDFNKTLESAKEEEVLSTSSDAVRGGSEEEVKFFLSAVLGIYIFWPYMT